MWSTPALFRSRGRAAASGLQGIPLGPSGEKIFLGLVGTNSTDGRAAIPFFDPGKESFLEYDIAKLIHGLATAKKPTVGFLSGLPMTGGLDPYTRERREPWAVYQQLSQLFDVKPLQPTNLKSVDPDVNVLVVVHPKQLSEDAQYALDQFVLRGGHLLSSSTPTPRWTMVAPIPATPWRACWRPSLRSTGPVQGLGRRVFPDKVVLIEPALCCHRRSGHRAGTAPRHAALHPID